VGRFLEHSRIFYFANGGQEEIYTGSATGCRGIYTNGSSVNPRAGRTASERVRGEILEAYLADNLKARILLKTGPTFGRGKLLGVSAAEAAGGCCGIQCSNFLIVLAEGKAPLSLPAATPARKRRTWRKGYDNSR